MMNWLKAGMALTFALCFSSVSAANLDHIHKQTHYSMLLTGWINIDKEGGVTGHRLDQDVAKLPPLVVTWVAQAVSEWRFAPYEVDGKAAVVEAQMRLRLLVEPIEGGDKLRVRVVSANFGGPPPEHLVRFGRTPTHRWTAYPKKARKFGATGIVYLAIQVGRDGKPKQIMAQQVNLTVVDSEKGMELWRRTLADAAVRAANDWRFVPPSAGPDATASDWTVRGPVHFVMKGQKAPEAGEWQLYIPGPKQPIPWKLRVEDRMAGVDAMSPDEIHTVGSGLQLLTPLGAG